GRTNLASPVGVHRVKCSSSQSAFHEMPSSWVALELRADRSRVDDVLAYLVVTPEQCIQTRAIYAGFEGTEAG
ncbi:MAG TPA: hypothetical protein VE994_15985, partial [Terriglobales bacterium]|nr:hypothetical protein [Terriglobales bacterium]